MSPLWRVCDILLQSGDFEPIFLFEQRRLFSLNYQCLEDRINQEIIVFGCLENTAWFIQIMFTHIILKVVVK